MTNARHAEECLKGGANERSDTPMGYTYNWDGISGPATRKSIHGIPGYTISADGIPRKWGRRIDIQEGAHGLPVIDVQGIELCLDEVVAWAFFGPPKGNIRGMTVVHFDRDPMNCRVTNLAWRVCPEWAQDLNHQEHRGYMRPDFLPAPEAIPAQLGVLSTGPRPTKQRMHFFT